MKSRLGIFFLLLVLSLEGVAANNIVGAEPVRAFLLRKCGQGQAPPIQIYSSPEFTVLRPDGVAATGQQRRKRRRRNSQRRARVYGIQVTPDEGGASPPPPPPEPMPQEAPNTGASPPPPQARPVMAAPGRSAPPKRSAPKIKPPTVQIKPPTR